MDTRGREADLASVIAAHPALLGIGIDQSAAIIVHGNSFFVVGGQVVIHDNRQHDGAPYYFLSAGQSFNLQTRSPDPMPNSPLTLTVETATRSQKRFQCHYRRQFEAEGCNAEVHSEGWPAIPRARMILLRVRAMCQDTRARSIAGRSAWMWCLAKSSIAFDRCDTALSRVSDQNLRLFVALHPGCPRSCTEAPIYCDSEHILQIAPTVHFAESFQTHRVLKATTLRHETDKCFQTCRPGVCPAHLFP